jgi:hypothetical protein
MPVPLNVHYMWTLPICPSTYTLLSVGVFKRLSTINSIYNVSPSSSMPHLIDKLLTFLTWTTRCVCTSHKVGMLSMQLLVLYYIIKCG